jgi:Tfp pilus assembly protein PilN
MKAVNLIPADERGGGAKSLGSYTVLGVLALIVAMSATYALANRSIVRHQQELGRIEAQAQAAEAQTRQLSAYTGLSATHKDRADKVRQLAAGRFDWAHAIHEVSRTIPSNAWLTSMRGTVNTGVTLEGGADDPLRASVQSPAIELVGCTTSQDDVARVISSLRRVDGVTHVSVSSSEKLDQATGATGDIGADQSDCRHGDVHYPQFSMTLFFAAPSGAPAATTGAATP